jgi:hypothetical protein
VWLFAAPFFLTQNPKSGGSIQAFDGTALYFYGKGLNNSKFKILFENASRTKFAHYVLQWGFKPQRKTGNPNWDGVSNPF